jgi:hypothetical protein
VKGAILTFSNTSAVKNPANTASAVLMRVAKFLSIPGFSSAIVTQETKIKKNCEWEGKGSIFRGLIFS